MHSGGAGVKREAKRHCGPEAGPVTLTLLLESDTEVHIAAHPCYRQGRAAMKSSIIHMLLHRLDVRLRITASLCGAPTCYTVWLVVSYYLGFGVLNWANILSDLPPGMCCF